jgi:SAM-dependent methyltransferase
MRRQHDNTSEHRPFDADSAQHGGYLYTTNQLLSSRIAIERQTREVSTAYNFTAMSVVDIGRGDAGISIDLYDHTHPARMEGIDPASNAIEIGKSRINGRRIQLSVASAYNLPFSDSMSDVAHLRGVLHHMETPAVALREAARVARSVVVLEPNGYNPLLKAIEIFSPYHRRHGERSFLASTIDRWMREAGMSITYRNFCCLVPYFCPDFIARALKTIEAAAEATPGFRLLACGAYVVTGERRGP